MYGDERKSAWTNRQYNSTAESNYGELPALPRGWRGCSLDCDVQSAESIVDSLFATVERYARSRRQCFSVQVSNFALPEDFRELPRELRHFEHVDCGKTLSPQ